MRAKLGAKFGCVSRVKSPSQPRAMRFVTPFTLFLRFGALFHHCIWFISIIPIFKRCLWPILLPNYLIFSFCCAHLLPAF